MLTPQEELNLKISESFNPEVDKVFMLPDHISADYYEANFPTWKIIRVNQVHLSSNRSYNKFLLSDFFYQPFRAYRFLLICQSDAVLVRNVQDLPVNFDYIGAPWKTAINFRGLDLRVGNGGLSLRRVSVFYWLTRVCWFLKRSNTHEDILFSYLGKLRFLRVPSYEIADDIFKEETTEGFEVPDHSYGFHALEKWNGRLQTHIHEQYLKGLHRSK